jgi:hypothetical protein
MCNRKQHTYTKTILRTLHTKEHKVRAKHLKLKENIDYTESVESISYVAIITIFSSLHSNAGRCKFVEISVYSG